MKRLPALLAIAATVSMFSTARAADSAKVYNGTDPVDTNLILPTDGTGCGPLLLNSDGSYENAYAWQYGGIARPLYGAFAECYSTTGQDWICSVVFDLTQIGNQAGQSMEVYVWADDGGIPGNVMCGPAHFTPGTIAFWPNLSRHVFDPDPNYCCWHGPFWVGYWGVWPGEPAGWFVGADLDGPGGCPMTNIAPGIGFPTGWTNTSQVWGPTQALGIGCELEDCHDSPVEQTTWGAVKHLYSH